MRRVAMRCGVTKHRASRRGAPLPAAALRNASRRSEGASGAGRSGAVRRSSAARRDAMRPSKAKRGKTWHGEAAQRGAGRSGVKLRGRSGGVATRHTIVWRMAVRRSVAKLGGEAWRRVAKRSAANQLGTARLDAARRGETGSTWQGEAQQRDVGKCGVELGGGSWGVATRRTIAWRGAAQSTGTCPSS